MAFLFHKGCHCYTPFILISHEFHEVNKTAILVISYNLKNCEGDITMLLMFSRSSVPDSDAQQRGKVGNKVIYAIQTIRSSSVQNFFSESNKRYLYDDNNFYIEMQKNSEIKESVKFQIPPGFICLLNKTSKPCRGRFIISLCN